MFLVGINVLMEIYGRKLFLVESNVFLVDINVVLVRISVLADMKFFFQK